MNHLWIIVRNDIYLIKVRIKQEKLQAVRYTALAKVLSASVKRGYKLFQSISVVLLAKKLLFVHLLNAQDKNYIYTIYYEQIVSL